MITRTGPFARTLKLLAVAVLALWTLTPIYIVVSNAFRRTLDIKKMPPDLIFEPVLMHFERLLALDNFLRYFFNSVIIAGLTTVVAISFGTLAAYGLKLFRSRLGERLSNLLLLGKLVPAITVLLPLFTIMNRLSLTGTYPLTVGIARYVGAVSVDWGKSSAAATIALVPILIVGFILQKHLVTGMTAGAIKG